MPSSILFTLTAAKEDFQALPAETRKQLRAQVVRRFEELKGKAPQVMAAIKADLSVDGHESAIAALSARLSEYADSLPEELQGMQLLGSPSEIEYVEEENENPPPDIVCYYRISTTALIGEGEDHEHQVGIKLKCPECNES